MVSIAFVPKFLPKIFLQRLLRRDDMEPGERFNRIAMPDGDIPNRTRRAICISALLILPLVSFMSVSLKFGEWVRMSDSRFCHIGLESDIPLFSLIRVLSVL